MTTQVALIFFLEDHESKVLANPFLFGCGFEMLGGIKAGGVQRRSIHTTKS
jgi:hypothetical protein